MEHLKTYWWAYIIIIILIALFFTGKSKKCSKYSDCDTINGEDCIDGICTKIVSQ